MKNNKKGFTLIELLVVIAIIGLLSTLSILALNSARARARDAKRIADVKQIQTALEMFYNDTGDYPTAASTTPGAAISSANGTYMKAIPTPPTPHDGGCPAANAYTYTYTAGTGGTGSASTYGIAYCLGASINSIPAGAIQTAGPSGMKQ